MICLRWILGYMRLEIWCKIGLRLMHATTGLAEAIIRRGGRWWHVTKYVYQKLLKSNNACSIYSWKRRQSFFETQSIWHMMGTSPVSMFSNKDMYCQKVQFRLIDWVAVVHSTQNGSYRRCFPKPVSWLGMEKTLNLTQQKHTFTNQKKCTKTQKKRHPTWEWSGSVLKGKDKQGRR